MYVVFLGVYVMVMEKSILRNCKLLFFFESNFMLNEWFLKCYNLSIFRFILYSDCFVLNSFILLIVFIIVGIIMLVI